jgi:hypothetical protein
MGCTAMETAAFDMATDPRCTSPTMLYRYFDEDGDLLYVGIAWEHYLRDRQHFKTSLWYRYATHCSVEDFPTRYLAEWGEARAIHDEKPEFNRKNIGPLECVSVWDKWYLEVTGGKPVGQGKRWFRLGWKAEPVYVPWLELHPCDPPASIP